MNSSLLEYRGKTRTPPLPPNSKNDKGDGDSNNQRGYVLVYGTSKAKLEEILHIPIAMAGTIWQNMFHISSFTDIDALDECLYRQVLQNPKLLVSLTYLITQENVNRCLGSFLGFFEKVPGFSSSSDLQKTIQGLKGRIGEQRLQEIFPDNPPEESLKSVILRGESKARVVEVLSCEHLGDDDLRLTGEMDPLLERLDDVGRIIGQKFSGKIRSGPLRETIVAHMTNFAMFGGEL